MNSKVCPTHIIPKSYSKYSKPGRLWRVSPQLKQASQRKVRAAWLHIHKISESRKSNRWCKGIEDRVRCCPAGVACASSKSYGFYDAVYQCPQSGHAVPYTWKFAKRTPAPPPVMLFPRVEKGKGQSTAYVSFLSSYFFCVPRAELKDSGDFFISDWQATACGANPVHHLFVNSVLLNCGRAMATCLHHIYGHLWKRLRS